MDKESIIGIFGTVSSITLGQWNHIAGICAALFTITYMSIKIYKSVKNGD